MTGPARALTARGVAVRMERRMIVSGVDLDVAAGEVVGVVGPNGSGKSTLLRALAGLSPIASGTVRVGDAAVHTMSSRARARALSFVGQEEDPTADLLVHEYVALGRAPHTTPWSVGGRGDREIVDRALLEVGMHGHWGDAVDALSGGERRRVVLARGLAQQAGVLVLDEPTNHLDIRYQLELLDLVRNSGRAVLMAIHDLDLAAAVCDRVLVLASGTVRACGDPAEVLVTEVVADVFGVAAYEVVNPVTGRSHLVFEPHRSRHPSTDPESAHP